MDSRESAERTKPSSSSVANTEDLEEDDEMKMRKKVGNEEDGWAVEVRLRRNQAHIISKSARPREKTHAG